MIYEHFANKPGVHNTLRDFFSTYRHLQAEMYIPEVAALFVEPDGEILPDGPVNDWPFDTAWLTPPEEGRWMWARVLAGEELTMVLQTL